MSFPRIRQNIGVLKQKPLRKTQGKLPTRYKIIIGEIISPPYFRSLRMTSEQ